MPSRRRSVPIFCGLLINRTGGLPVPVWIAVIFSFEIPDISQQIQI
jgi:hypothetical protein